MSAPPRTGGKKLYTVTAEGEAFLEANRAHVDNLTARMAEAAARSTASAPQILRATHNLKVALKMKLTSGGADGRTGRRHRPDPGRRRAHDRTDLTEA